MNRMSALRELFDVIKLRQVFKCIAELKVLGL